MSSTTLTMLTFAGAMGPTTLANFSNGQGSLRGMMHRYAGFHQCNFGFAILYGPPLTFHQGSWVSVQDYKRIPGNSFYCCSSTSLHEASSTLVVDGGSRNADRTVSSVPVRWPDSLDTQVEVHLARNLPWSAIAGQSRCWRNIPLP